MQENDWRDRQAAHRARVRPWIEPRLERRRAGVKDPVDDFMFEYYPYRPGRLSAWHPGHGVTVEGRVDEFLAHPAYVAESGGATTTLAALGPKRDRIALVLRLLERTEQRPALLGCFGLHEWAMVYRQRPDEVRHAAFPLRLAPAAIADVVDDLGLRCTHIDAYRFFTPAAAPLNAHRPTRATQHDFEQPGCLHATMDLYKYAMWFSPWVSSELVADCFELARTARNLDMRASPYDLSPQGLVPIAIETPEGRFEYARIQRELIKHAIPLRRRLLSALECLHDESTEAAPLVSP